MRALVERSREPAPAYRVARVLSDRPDAPGLELARDLGVDAQWVPFHALSAEVDDSAAELIVLAGFMRILAPEFVARHAGRILNIHPSLLPKYPGLDTHRRVLAAKDAVHGATVHFVSAELDAGPPVIQARIKVEPDDDEASLAARVMIKEHRIYPMAVNWYGSGRLRCHDGQAWLDGAALGAPVLYEGGQPMQPP
jgi:phosphoribosylglycinamide formyltransferase-1